MVNAEGVIIGGHHCGQVSTELKRDRSQVRIAEVQSTLIEHRSVANVPSLLRIAHSTHSNLQVTEPSVKKVLFGIGCTSMRWACLYGDL